MHILSKADEEARIEPPIYALCLRLVDAVTSKRVSGDAIAAISF